MSMIVQAVLSILYTASIYYLVAMGIGLIYQVARFYHMAHAGYISFGACAAWFFFERARMQLPLCVIAASMLAALMAAASYIMLHRLLARRASPAVNQLLLSFGVFIILESTLALIMGEDIRAFRHGLGGAIGAHGVFITPGQIVTLSVACLVFGGSLCWLYCTQAGLLHRAVSGDSSLARSIGIRVDSVIVMGFAMGAGFAALAGALLALDISASPRMGFTPMIMGIVAYAVGRGNAVIRPAAGALLLSSVQWIGARVFFGGWQEAIAFGLLAVCLCAGWLKNLSFGYVLVHNGPDNQ